MKDVFVVTREGVYCQGVVSVSTTLVKAVDDALSYLHDENDDYHEFLVEKHVVDCTDSANPEEFVIRLSQDEEGEIYVQKTEDGGWEDFDHR